MSKHLPPCLRLEVHPSGCRGGGGGNLNWTWYVVSITRPRRRTFSTLTTTKGQDLARGSGGSVVAGTGTGSGTCTCWGLVLHHTPCPRAGQSMAVLPHPRLMVGLVRRGDKQYENIILANYSPASLVLSKLLWSKKDKGSTPLKNYSFKYLQKQLWYIT